MTHFQECFFFYQIIVIHSTFHKMFDESDVLVNFFNLHTHPQPPTPTPTHTHPPTNTPLTYTPQTATHTPKPPHTPLLPHTQTHTPTHINRIALSHIFRTSTQCDFGLSYLISHNNHRTSLPI